MNVRSVMDITIVEMMDPLDIEILDDIEIQLMDMIKAGAKKLIIDLKHVHAFHARGLRVLLSTRRNIRRFNGDVKLTGLQPYSQKVLRVNELDSLFTIYPSIEHALVAFSAHAHG